jgi:hypothetical protein
MIQNSKFKLNSILSYNWTITAGVYKHLVLGRPCDQNFVQLRLKFVNTQYGTSLLSFWLIEF